MIQLITVAVCTRNRPADLSRCLESLDRIAYSHLDILIIDNASDDDATRRIISDYPSFRYIFEPNPGLSIARNRAIHEAKGDIIAFTDDDVIVDQNWVGAIVRAFHDNPRIMAITGLVVPFELETEPQWIFETMDGFGRGLRSRWLSAAGKKHIAITHGGTGKYGTGANMAFRRELFDRIGYFDPCLGAGTLTTGGEDLDMFFRVIKEGYTLLYEPEAIVYHRHRRHYDDLRCQYESWGIAFTSYMVRNATKYPDERLGFAVQWMGTLINRHLRRLVKSMKKSSPFKTDLILNELKGSFIGLSRYRKSAASALKSGQKVPTGNEWIKS